MSLWRRSTHVQVAGPKWMAAGVKEDDVLRIKLVAKATLRRFGG